MFMQCENLCQMTSDILAYSLTISLSDSFLDIDEISIVLINLIS